MLDSISLLSGWTMCSLLNKECEEREGKTSDLQSLAHRYERTWQKIKGKSGNTAKCNRLGVRLHHSCKWQQLVIVIPSHAVNAIRKEQQNGSWLVLHQSTWHHPTDHFSDKKGSLRHTGRFTFLYWATHFTICFVSLNFSASPVRPNKQVLFLILPLQRSPSLSCWHLLLHLSECTRGGYSLSSAWSAQER